jgi:hypothetical protein
MMMTRVRFQANVQTCATIYQRNIDLLLIESATLPPPALDYSVAKVG